MTQITIPTSIEDVRKHLGALGILLTAKNWERAAIVAAFVEARELGTNQHSEGASSGTLSPKAFAALGISGLKSPETVRAYIQAWESTGRPRPRPGEAVDLDGLPEWPPAESTVDAIKRNTKATAVALADEATRRKVLERLDPQILLEFILEAFEDADIRHSAAEAIIHHGEDGAATPRPRDPNKPRDYSRLIESAVNNISVALGAVASGRWEIPAHEEALLYFLTRLLGERLAPQGELADMVQTKLAKTFDEIEQYANTGSTK